MEWLLLLLLVALIGVGGVLRAMFMAAFGLMVLIGAVAWLVTTDFSQWHWWALGLLLLLIVGVWDEVRRRDNAAKAPQVDAARR